MTHDQSSQFRASRTYQCGGRVTEEKVLQRQCCSGTKGAIRSIQAASIPIYSRGSKDKTQVTDTGAKGGIYCQAPCELGFSSQTICNFYRGIIKQYCGTGLGGIYQTKEAWLGGVHKDRSICFTVLIGWPSVNSRKSIDCWFQRRLVLPVGSIQI